eukprot:GHVQ01020864.1.p1 GENE.GHVQ01020864.1~~GHVQ01020864.1.p1  ORF type:complete len:237 (+),score=12.59 GHVQ01020864.1:128-838(+)
MDEAGETTDRVGPQEPPSKLQLVVTHGMIVGLFCLVLGWVITFIGLGFDKVIVFGWHPLLNVTAYGVVTAEAILAYRVWEFEHDTQKTMHGVLHVLTVFLGVMALTAVLVYHTHIGVPPFQSAHSWVGLFVYLMTWSQFIGGMLFWIPGAASPSLKARLIPFHKFMGLFIFVSSLAAMVSGIMRYEGFVSKEGLDGFGIYSNIIALWILVTAGTVLWYHVGPSSNKTRQVYSQLGQ